MKNKHQIEIGGPFTETEIHMLVSIMSSALKGKNDVLKGGVGKNYVLTIIGEEKEIRDKVWLPIVSIIQAAMRHHASAQWIHKERSLYCGWGLVDGAGENSTPTKTEPALHFIRQSESEEDTGEPWSGCFSTIPPLVKV